MRVIATAGHVDHGKSALVRALTGTDPDRFPEEKARGLTIDLGFAFTTLAGNAPRGGERELIGFVDVPGHIRFAKNMLAGVGSVDIAMLVVDAREGWMPQTAEHVQILELLGIAHGCVALTKADLVDAATLELARLDLDEHLSGTSLHEWPVVICDAVSGRGIDDLRDALAAVCRTTPPASDLHAPRLWVDRAFSVRGVGTVVTGTLTLGALAVGDHVRVEPGGRAARVRGIESHHERLEYVPPGTRVALNLAGLDADACTRGDAVVRPDTFVSTQVVDVRLLPVEGAQLADRATLHAHLGSGEWPVRWRAFPTDAAGPRFGRVRFRSPLPLQIGDHMVLRSSARRAVMGGAVVVDVEPPRRTHDAIARHEAANAMAAVVVDGRAVTALELARRTGIDRADPSAAIDDAIAAGVLVALGDRYVAPATAASLAEAAAREVANQAPAIASTPDGARLLEALRADLFAPPSPESVGIAPRIGKLLAREGAAVELDGVLFAREALEEATRRVGDAVLARGSLTIADIRDLLGSTRKFVLPIAKRLDADGVTRRRGDDRIPGPRAAAP